MSQELPESGLYWASGIWGDGTLDVPEIVNLDGIFPPEVYPMNREDPEPPSRYRFLQKLNPPGEIPLEDVRPGMYLVESPIDCTQTVVEVDSCGVPGVALYVWVTGLFAAQPTQDFIFLQRIEPVLRTEEVAE